MTPRLDTRLQKGINAIREKILEMGEMTVSALKSSLKAYQTHDRQLAYYVILRDRFIDEIETELDQLCQEFLIREQPAGQHLRFVYAAIKINNELERIGDYAESIATQFLSVSSLEVLKKFPAMDQIAEVAIPMLQNAINAFADQNPELAADTIEADEDVNELRNTIQHQLIKQHDAGKIPSEALSPLMIITSRFERVADQACNICEEVQYMCTGQNVKHAGEDVIRILFVDETDATRGPIARAIGRSLELPDFQFSSAGFTATTVDPAAVTFMADQGIDISGHKSKNINQILNPDSYDVIVTLCKEAEKAFPPSSLKTARIRWKIKNPAKAKGGKKEITSTYEKVYRFLDSHIRDLVKAIEGNQNKQKEES